MRSLRVAPLAVALVAAVAVLGAAPPVAAFEGIASRAEVAGPRGAFTTEIVSLGDGTVRFVQVHPEWRSEMLAVGDEAFERAEASGTLVPTGVDGLDVVRGHDVHRIVLTLRAAGGEERPSRITLPPPAESSRESIVVELSDWRAVHGVELPFAAAFLHAGERFDYRYTEVLPFRLAPGAELPADPESLFDRLGDLALLVGAHERVMAAHRASDAELLVADAAPETTVSGRGRLTETTRDAFVERMRGYLGAIRFSRYEDTVVPVVAVSADGTLGWLACEMEAEGVRTEGRKREKVAYGFSWVELYGRAPDAPPATPYTALGNASSERPAP
jgi:hypothetical protein